MQQIKSNRAFVASKSKLAAGISLAMFVAANPAFAQGEDSASASEPRVQEVMVYGIKTSLLDAIEMKRNNVGVMEAISAEDFGKFPDGNLAESLARVPGIAIDRSNVEGQAIAVRGFGPEFNLVTLNGRQMPTVSGRWGGGRSFNFGDIASPGVSAVEVFKAANSTLPSGGIGSTVNMVTTRPLMVEGTKKSFSASIVEDTTSEASGTPFETALLYATNQDKWGFSLSGSYQERTNRESGTRESNWITPEVLQNSEGYLRVDATNPAYTNNNTRSDGNTFFQEPSAYLIKDNDRVRTNAQATFQYAFTEALVGTVDYTYSKVDFSSEGTMFGSWLGGWDTSAATINANGVFTDVTVGNRSYDHTVTWGQLDNENNSVGFNLAWDVNDNLVLEFDGHHSTAEQIGNVFDNELGVTSDNRGNITSINGGASGVNTFSYDTDFNASNMMITSLALWDDYQENVIDQFQVKGTWNNSADSILTSVDFGVSTAESKFTKQRRRSNFSSNSPSAADYDDALFARTGLGNFMNSFSPDIGTDYYFEVNARDGLAAFIANNAAATDPVDGAICCELGGLDSNERVNESLDSVFVQFNMATEIGAMPLNIVAGMRYEKSDTESISYYPAPTTIRWDMIAGLIGVGGDAVDAPRYGSNNTFLPSVAFSLGITEDQVVRLSWSRSMARPSLTDLRSEMEIGNQDFFNLTAEGGNPDLNPLLSTNWDISYENYYAEGSYFAVNYFRKEIKDFIGNRTVADQPIEGLTNPFLSSLGQFAQSCVQDWIDAGRPQPGFPGDAGATGDCVSQQALWAQPWMNDQQHMGWVALAMARGIDVSNGFPWGACDYGGWWRCEPGYIDGTASDPAALFDITQPFNMNKGTVSGFEVTLQHLFEGTPFGFQFNATKISGGDVSPNRNFVGEQFVLPGLGDSGNASVFYEDDKHTLRLALNYRGETAAGFANYNQPVYIDERKQIDISYQYRFNDSTTLFVDAANVTDEETRLYVRYPEMLFLAQDHGPVYKFGVRTNF